MSAAVPATTTARFQAFQAHHGPIAGPLTDRILGTMLDRAIFRFFDYSPQVPLGVFVANEMKRLSPDILAILELAADWSSDPLKAAERQLRPDLDAKAKAEAEAKKRAEEAALQSALTAKADAFMEQLKSGALTLA